MASSSEDQQSQSKGETVRPPASSTGNNAPPMGGYPPPTMGYPHGQHPGYPPAMAYPHGHHPGFSPPPNYHGYPQNGYSGYAYAQAPPAAYYTNPTYQIERGNSGFARGVISALILLVALICVSSIITWVVLRPEIPIFKINAFSVADLNLTKTNYSGIWEAKVAVENTNHKLNIHFDRVQTFIDHQDHTLAMSFVDPFFLDVQKSSQVQVKLSSYRAEQPVDWDDAVEEMGKERATGIMSFNLRLFAWSTLRSGSWWTRHVIMRVFCEDLKVGFPGIQATSGLLIADGQPKTCFVYI